MGMIIDTLPGFVKGDKGVLFKSFKTFWQKTRYGRVEMLRTSKSGHAKQKAGFIEKRALKSNSSQGVECSYK
jgi:hypothetical protein